MIDPARLRQTAAILRAEADALDAMLEAEATPLPPPRPPAVQPLPTAVGKGLQNAAGFFAVLRDSELFGAGLTKAQVAGCERLCNMGAGRLPLPWMAYVLASAYHEGNHGMVPIREKGNGDRDGDGVDDYFEQYDVGAKAVRLGNTPEADGDGADFAGKGDIQITGRRNYEFATRRLRELGILSADQDLVKTPLLALEPTISAAIAVIGCVEGWFTGLKLNDFINRADLGQFTAARAIVNGSDKAALIAGYAMIFARALQAGGWL